MKLRKWIIIIIVFAVALTLIRNTQFVWSGSVKGIWVRVSAGMMIGLYHLDSTNLQKETAFVCWINDRPRFGIGWLNDEFVFQRNPQTMPQ